MAYFARCGWLAAACATAVVAALAGDVASGELDTVTCFESEPVWTWGFRTSTLTACFDCDGSRLLATSSAAMNYCMLDIAHKPETQITHPPNVALKTALIKSTSLSDLAALELRLCNLNAPSHGAPPWHQFCSWAAPVDTFLKQKLTA